MNEPTLTPEQICKAAGIPASTLRTWHNRLGLQKRSPDGAGWRRYSPADALQILFVARLTTSSWQAQEAVAISDVLRPHIERAAEGFPDVVCIFAQLAPGKVDVRVLPSGFNSQVDEWVSAIHYLDDPMATLIDFSRLNTILIFSLAAANKGGES